jgi:hypothetical protein
MTPLIDPYDLNMVHLELFGHVSDPEFRGMEYSQQPDAMPVSGYVNSDGLSWQVLHSMKTCRS